MLESFAGAKVELEQPQPFQPHVVKLVVTKTEVETK
jgi:hypothetical protein